jgi:hypothetical protein
VLAIKIYAVTSTFSSFFFFLKKLLQKSKEMIWVISRYSKFTLEKYVTRIFTYDEERTIDLRPYWRQAPFVLISIRVN